MKLNRLLAAMALTTFAALGSTAALAQDFKARNARFGHGMADAHPAGQAAKQFATEMEKASGGARVFFDDKL